MSTRRSSRPFVEELPGLLEDRGLSIRAIARAADVDAAHLSRVLRGARGKTTSPELARRVAEALGLPSDYFPEWREAVILRRIREDPALRDRIYDRVRRK
jgi:transcriptional regulator with XRE-family HTH domain